MSKNENTEFLTVGRLKNCLNKFDDDQRVLVALIYSHGEQSSLALRSPTKTFQINHPAHGDPIMCLGFEVQKEYFDLPEYVYE